MEKQKPKYLKLAEWIKKNISDGELGPGDRLYSENELCSLFGISRQTVRHGISILEHEGVLERIQGSGTYISKRPAETGGRRIALVSTYVDNYIFPELIESMQSTLLDGGYEIQIGFTNNRTEREREILQEILENPGITGIIIEATKSAIPNPNLELYQKIKSRRIPVLFFNSYYPGLSIPHVTLDDEAAGYMAATHLVGMGHKEIGGIFKSDDGQGHLRYKGYVRALKEAKIPLDDIRVLWMDTEDIRYLEKSKERILERISSCTALLCYNDEAAYALAEILQREGIRVPAQISLVSIDDSDLAVKGSVRLTSIRFPVRELGRRAAENLLCLIRNPDYDASYEFAPQLIPRESVREI